MYYAHKKSIVKVEQINEPFTVFTLGGEQLGSAGDYLSVSLTGEREVLPKEVFDEEYVAVQLVETKQKKQLSPFEEQTYYRLFGETANINQEEDKQYIENTKKLIQNKAF